MWKVSDFQIYFKSREAETEVSHLLGHFPNDCNSQGAARLKPAAQNSIWVFPFVWAGIQALEPSLLSLRVCIGWKLDSGVQPF